MAGAVEQGEDLDRLACNSVGSDIRCALNDQLSSACNAAWATHFGVVGEPVDGALDGFDLPIGSVWVLYRNELVG